MFQFFNKKIKAVRDSLKPAFETRRGQVAIVLIFITAIALIFYAVLLNLSKVSQIKTAATMSANLTAANLGSLMASYGESIFQTTLGGKRKVCGFTGVFTAILTIVLIIVIVVIAIFTPGLGATLFASVPAIIVAAVLLTASVILEMVVVNPGMTKMWQKMMDAATTPRDRFIENGVRGALQTIVSDRVEVDDFRDSDMDRVYALNVSGQRTDSSSRFAYHYTQRLKRIQPIAVTAVNQFIAALRSFVLVSSDYDWGLYDPVNCTLSPSNPCCAADPQNLPSICNPCCLPRFYPNCPSCEPPVAYPVNYTPPLKERAVRADCCDLLATDQERCGYALWPPPSVVNKTRTVGLNTFQLWPYEKRWGTSTRATTNLCAQNSPFGDRMPYIYQPYLDNEYNGIARLSFREKLGGDDPNLLFRARPASPHAYNPPQTFPEPVIPVLSTGPGVQTYNSHRIEDVTGYHPNPPSTEVRYSINLRERLPGPPVQPDPPLPRPSVFEGLHKMTRWGIDLDLAATRLAIPGPYGDQLECHWTDPQWAGSVVDCTVAPRTGWLPDPPSSSQKITQLFLPVDPASVFLTYNTTPFVDGINPGAPTDPPLTPDLINKGVAIVSPINSCPWGYTLTPSTPTPARGLYKIGTDRYCSIEDSYPLHSDDPSPPVPPALAPAVPRIPGPANSGFVNWVSETNWPYFSRCPSHGTWGNCQDPGPPPENVDCVCENSDASQEIWNDDSMDNIIYGLVDFIQWAESIYTGDPAKLAEEFEIWYPSAAEWIEQAGRGYIAGPEDGGLWVWFYELSNWFIQIDRWLVGTDSANPPLNWGSPQWSGPDTAWCYPPQVGAPGGPPYQPVGEQNAINYTLINDPNPPVTYTFPYVDSRSIEGVVNCLDWNAYSPTPTWTNPITVIGFPTLDNLGNDFKFGVCSGFGTFNPLNCAQHARTCGDLPRSQLPQGTLMPSGPYDQVPNRIRPVLEDMTNCGFGLNSVSPVVPPCNVQFCGPAFIHPSVGNPPFNPATHCVGGVPGIPDWGHPDFINLVNAFLTETNPVTGPSRDCFNPAWLEGTWASALESVNQVAKFRHRLQVLDGDVNLPPPLGPGTTYGLVDNMKQLRYILLEAIIQFWAFLDPSGGPAANLIQARRDFDTRDPATQRQAVYAWQSEPTNANPGKWHVVRVDVRIPGRCDDKCGASAANSFADPQWPRVNTYTKRWGIRRCYVIAADRGRVKAMIMRWDEPQADGNTITFPGGWDIWRFVFRNPNARPLNIPDIDAYVRNNCEEFMDPEGLTIGEGAFLLDKRDDTIKTISTIDCWDDMQRLIASGVKSEACAEYYFREGTRAGFNIKFVPCEAPW